MFIESEIQKSLSYRASSKDWPATLDLRKNGPPKKRTRSKNRTSKPITLPFVSCHMKDNVEVIHFHIKGGGV